MNFGSPGRPRGASKIDCSATFFDFFARLSLQSCSWGLLRPFRVDFSSIFRRSWHDFWSISSRFFVALLSVCCASWADFGSIIFDRTPPLWKKNLLRATKKRVQVVLIRSHDGYLDFLDGSAVIPFPPPFRFLNLFLLFFW